MKTLLFQMISTLLIVICMVSTFLYFVVKKKKISKTLNDKEDFFLKIGIGIILLIVLFKMFIPTILDIPHYLKNDFNVVSGYAREEAYPQALNFASSLNPTFYNIGIAAGSLVGGALLAQTGTYAWLGPAGAVLALAACACAVRLNHVVRARTR